MIIKDRLNENGIAMVMVLAFIGVAVPLVAGGLAFASVLSLDSSSKTQTALSQYSVIGASQHAAYRSAYEIGYSDGLTPGVEDTYTINLNGTDIQISVMKTSDPPTGDPPVSADNGRKLQATKTVDPSTTTPSTLTTYNYAVTVANRHDETVTLKKVFDGLPSGFTYVAGSTAGVTIADPTIELNEGEDDDEYYQLMWNLSPLQVDLAPAETALLTFSAQASVPTGNYCNVVWVDPGGEKTSTGPTARVEVGTPLNTLCTGEAARVLASVDPDIVAGGVLTTYTFTLTVENIGTEELELEKIRYLLPVGFTYVAGSTSGDITTADPNSKMHQGRNRLDWNLEEEEVDIDPGVTKTIVFEATAQVDPGDYWSDIWVWFDEFEDKLYTWPTAPVNVMGVMGSTSSDGQTSGALEIWLGSDSYLIADRDLER